ncbi:MAG: DUF480 domain-containing protein [Planctomycetota bacterium]|nr:MAG: DUF480 domain-containing protein [Planctomycetota bacterium]
MDADTQPPGSRIRPLDAVERRVLGVLIEKAKTTPEAYPLSLNAVITGCNQKSNREPVMTVDEDQVSSALDSLRAAGAVTEYFGSGRVPRYRHHAYEWFGNVEKEELSILAELLLRGEQSEGDLRGRASRMDPIADLTLLRSLLDKLAERGLVVWLSPPGRGRILTHGLLPEEKLEKVRAKLGIAGQAFPAGASGTAEAAADGDDPALDCDQQSASNAGTIPRAAQAAGTPPKASPPPPILLQPLVEKIAGLEAEVAALRSRLDALERALGN